MGAVFGRPLFYWKAVRRLRIRSAVTDRVYEQAAMVYISNPTQIAKYMKHKCTLYDLLEIDDKLVGVFSKEETRPLYELWKVHEL